MVFILHARLRAQLVDPPKSMRVLNDVFISVFREPFMNEVFRPQNGYSNVAMRKVFSTICSTGIMRLSTNSLGKLLDLMTAGVKCQLIALRHPQEVYDWTLNHIDHMRAIAPAESIPLLELGAARLETLARGLSPGDYASIRQCILNTIVGTQVKVAILIENGLQLDDGTFVIKPPRGLPAADGCEAPGTIRYVSHGQPVSVSTFAHRDSMLVKPQAADVRDHSTCRTLQRRTHVGENMYQNASDALSAHARELPSKTSAHPIPHGGAGSAADVGGEEMNYLANLICAERSNISQEKFRLAILDDEDDDDGSNRPGYVPGAPSGGGVSPCGPSQTIPAATSTAVRVTSGGGVGVNEELRRIRQSMETGAPSDSSLDPLADMIAEMNKDL